MMKCRCRLDIPKNMHYFFYAKRLVKVLCLLLLTGMSTFMSSASEPLDIKKIKNPPRIDGVLDDEVWRHATGYDQFISFHPEYGKPSKEKTIVYGAYDEEHLYFAFRCLDREPGKIRSTFIRRDTSSRDGLAVVFIDSRNTGEMAYMFQSNPLGIQSDGVIDAGGYTDKNQDFLWESAGKKNSGGYAVEMKIPFKSLRFSKADVVEMKVSFLRKISRYSEQYTLPGWKIGEGSVPAQFSPIRLKGIRSTKLFEILPSVTYSDRRRRTPDGELKAIDDKKFDLGLTSKIGLSSDLTLDVTVNPDFSHIESDEGQVDVNLRVEALLDEKRPFFLEGLDHFTFAGTEESPIALIVHTRKIVDPTLGIKLSGQLGKSGLVNSLFAIDKSPKSITGGNNYFGVLRYKHIIKNDTYVGGIYTGKEFKGGFQRVGGMDARVRLNGSLFMDSFALFSGRQDRDSEDFIKGNAFGVKVNHSSRKYYGYLGYHNISEDFNLDTGRLLRNGIRIFSGYLERYIYFSSDILKRITVGYTGSIASDIPSGLDEYSHRLFTRLDFSSSTWLESGYNWGTEVYEKNLFDTDHFFVRGRSQITRHLYLGFFLSSGGGPYYEELEQGDVTRLSFFLNIQPITRLESIFTVKREIYKGRETSDNDYTISILRNKTTYHINKYFLLRGIVEYDSEDKQILIDALAEFTYIPGTVIHLGYGPTLGKELEVPGGNRFIRYDRFRPVSSSFFFKASYLFRF